MAEARLPQGITGLHVLPADHHRGPWESMVVPDSLRERLLGTALLVLRHAPALAQLSGPPHGLVLLSGPPGTGKSTLCQGLAQEAALALSTRGATTLVEVDPHSFPSELLGESQRAISRLFSDTLPEIAARRPHTVVIIDEVEAFAVRRSAASFEANPVDVHRATDAVLAGLDLLRGTSPRVLVLCTSNFPAGIDEAFLSRSDLVVHTELPDLPALTAIIRSTMAEVAVLWPGIRPLASDSALHEELAAITLGIDGRRARKLALHALSVRPELALDPELLVRDDLVRAAKEIVTW
ncbi:ATP-binding protein [Nocardioides agariphilus]|uniref:ATP-binding protein n=1 Tax=Nocardioides agariphilus TaxID=433664 RepID=A0A930VR82_9ACTN|nr:AAA family ATPase [Nocardioides agariphilus]MBF4769400.1 ATP-binding protein [Nocardioides agariphilus]